MRTFRSRTRTPRIAGERRMLVAMAVDATGSGMYVPFSLVFFHHVTGLPFATVGLVLTVVGLLGLGALPLAGAAVDRYGAQRVQLLLYGVRGAGFLLYPFAHALPAFAAVALATAFGDRAFPAVQQSLLGEVAQGADRDRLQASSRALRNGGLGAGSLLASLVVGFAGDAGFTVAAWLNAASFALAAVLMRGVRAERQAPAEGAARPSAGYRQVFADRPFLGLTAVNFLNALGYSALSVLFPLYITTWLRGPQAITGIAFTLNTVMCAAGGVVIAARVRSRGARRTRSAALGSLLFAAAFAAQIVLGTIRPGSGIVLGGALLLIVVLYTLGELVHSPSAGALSVTAAPEALRGRYLAAYQLSWSLSAAVAPSLFTALMAADGRLPWLLLVVTSLAAAGGLLRLERALPKSAVQVAPVVPVASVAPIAAVPAAVAAR
ncbi:MFS transporter [Streptomyces sp. NPDC001691]|uniref:MFS transporter n=1 Tax=unclassified Streptomyces TaxID=2593676 RepID=UPI000DEABFE7|nr:MFS transporter [Streptomyces sp. SDr-06]RCH68556.1 MFS transporter [Streptomyces sp. SDr-06]